ncbi:MAG: hypothetical protein MUF48_07115 [Pirellulaceae bacterium]|jgi:hypothetical protein|nr:hypothetical protein [Pirellulaceae bacterium]
MNTATPHRAGTAAWSPRRAATRPQAWWVWLTLLAAPLSGCGPDLPSATVDGMLRYRGQPLDNCLVTFLPEPGEAAAAPHSTGLTDSQGVFRLRFDNQQEGAAVGWHRVTVQDLSMTTGVLRRDHGAGEEGAEDPGPPTAARPSRVPDAYAILTTTPLRKQVQPGHQVIDVEIE